MCYSTRKKRVNLGRMNTRSSNKPAMPTNAARFDDLESKLDKLLEMQTAANTLMASLVKRLDSSDLKVEVITGEVHQHGVQLEDQQTTIEALKKELAQAADHIDILENRQREKNLNILDVPEQSEKTLGMIPFLVNLFETEWGLKLVEMDFEKAHRLGSLKSTRPRAIIFRVQHFQTRSKILQAVKERRSKKQDSEEDSSKYPTYRIIPDSSALVRKKRDAFWPLRERLHKLDITTRIKFPATLVVVDGEDQWMFSTVEEAETEMNKRYPK